MSIADSRGAVRHGSSIAAWSLILQASRALHEVCLNMNRGAGGMHIIEGWTLCLIKGS